MMIKELDEITGAAVRALHPKAVELVELALALGYHVRPQKAANGPNRSVALVSSHETATRPLLVHPIGQWNEAKLRALRNKILTYADPEKAAAWREQQARLNGGVPRVEDVEPDVRESAEVVLARVREIVGVHDDESDELLAIADAELVELRARVDELQHERDELRDERDELREAYVEIDELRAEVASLREARTQLDALRSLLGQIGGTA